MNAPYLEREEEHQLALRWRDDRDEKALAKLKRKDFRSVVLSREERDVVGIAGDQSIAAVVEATGDAVGSPVEVREIADAAAARSGG